MYSISESEITFLLDLLTETLNTEEVPEDEIREAQQLLLAMLENPKLEVA